MTTEKAMEQVPGSWSEFKCVDENAKKVFEKAIHNLVGVHYTPVAVSQQVVAGINYRFFCNSKVVYPHSLNGAAMVNIYMEPNGVPHVTSVMPIHL